MPRTGNKVSLLSCGRDVFKEIHAALISANHFIWIADWQMAFDVELVQRGAAGHPGQLHKVLENIIKTKKVEVRVILYGSVAEDKPGTFDGLVSRKLNSMNKPGYPGMIKVMLQKPTTTQKDFFDYSHHQKFVVVDGRVAFIGGIDLSYGRWETPEFDVVVDPSKMLINEMNNPCVPKLRPVSARERKIIKENDCAEPYGKILIDEGCQPRMPWQDVHMRIEGPSVVDIHRNFVRRWNLTPQISKTDLLNINLAAQVKHGIDLVNAMRHEVLERQWLEKAGALSALQSQQQLKGGGAQVQIVRSVSSGHLTGEGEVPDDLSLYPRMAERTTWEKGLKKWCCQHQDNILDAMINCIHSADNYIYIETQFFISSFGKWGRKPDPIHGKGATVTHVDSDKIGNENNGIKNWIAQALAMRIAHHIKGNTPFHVYMVVPVHPEGMVSDEPTWKQHWMALVTIKHGSDSLINRIKRALVDQKRDPEEWTQYLTLLNMRNHGATVQYARDPKTFDEDFSHEIGRFVVTEQIYIHSKLLIVDDAVAIVGSANTNDRSLTGNGDTEIAAVVVDTEGVELRDLGSPTMKPQTRKFARELRRQLWEKHFGFMMNSSSKANTAYVNSGARSRSGRAESEHPPRLRTSSEKVREIGGVSWQEILDRPCLPSVVKAIQTVATHNAKIYERVFQHTPRNTFAKFDAGLAFYTLPYAALYDDEGTRNLGASQIAPFEPKVAPLTQKQRENLANSREALNQRNEDNAGKSKKFRGVVPPALQPEFMTTQLMTHQKAALNERSYGRLQQLYPGGKVHDVDRAILFLKNNLVGFFIAMPLDWGMGTKIEGDPSKVTALGIDIAKIGLPTETAGSV